MVGWHHQLNGYEFEQAPVDSEGQGSLLCCSPWGCKESDTIEQLNNNRMITYSFSLSYFIKLNTLCVHQDVANGIISFFFMV